MMILTTKNRFTPARLSSCQVWLSGADPQNGTLPTNGTLLPAIINKGWNSSLVCSQSTGASQAPYISNAHNGKGVIRTTTGKYYNISGHTYGANTTMFLVATPTSGSNTYFFSSSGSPSNCPAFITNYSPGGVNKKYEWFNTNGTSTDRQAFAGTVSGMNICEIAQTDSVSLVTAFNGTETSNVVPTVANNGKNLILLLAISGLSTFFLGDFGDLIIFNATLSSAERMSVRRYLSDFWGIAVT